MYFNRDSTFSIAGEFLYLLGHPFSSEDSVSDKRLVSNMIKESGNECSLELTMSFENMQGTEIEITTQNRARAFTPIANIAIQRSNQTTQGQWRRFRVKIGRYSNPFLVSVDIARHKDSKRIAFIAIDKVRLIDCAPGKSIFIYRPTIAYVYKSHFSVLSENSLPVDCSAASEARSQGRYLPSEYYVCPDGQGVACQDAASMLCDFKHDCPGGQDEMEDVCSKYRHRKPFRSAFARDRNWSGCVLVRVRCTFLFMVVCFLFLEHLNCSTAGYDDVGCFLELPSSFPFVATFCFFVVRSPITRVPAKYTTHQDAARVGERRKDSTRKVTFILRS